MTEIIPNKKQKNDTNNAVCMVEETWFNSGFCMEIKK